MKQPAIITNGLSVIWSTNANGHVQAEVSLVDTNIPSTIARLDSPVFIGTVTFDTLVANTLQFPFANSIVYADSSSNAAPVTIGTNLTFVGGVLSGTGGGGGGTGTVVTASGGSDMSRANITTNGFGLLVTQSGTNILLSTTNNYPAGYYAGGFLPLFAGVSNALTGDLSMDQNSDVRLFMSETSRMLTDGYEVMGLRAYNGKLALHSFATNDLSAAEEFMVIDPSDLVGPTDIITFPNSGFNNKVVFEADVEFNGTSTFSGTTTFNDLAIGTITVVSNLTVPNNAYGAGWNGSTNVPNENSVYDEMELRATKASPTFSGALTNTGSIGAPVQYVGTTNIAEHLAKVSYALVAGNSASSHPPGDSTTRYIGTSWSGPVASYSQVSLVVPRSGTIVAWRMSAYIAGVLGTTETVSHYIRLNDTTDYGQIDLTYDAVRVSGGATLSQPVTAGDTLAVKMVFPAFTTNPTTVYYYATIVIQ